MAGALAANGAKVVLCDINEIALNEAVKSFGKAGAKAEACVLNVADTETTRSVIDDVVKRHGRLDSLFANAGVTAGPGYGRPEGQIENASLDLWDKSMAVNLRGAFITMQAAARQMKEQRRGAIIVTASASAFETSPLPAYAYHAAKAGVAHLTRLAARELGPFNVRVNAIAPGPFPTNMASGRLKDPAVAPLFVNSVPLGRMGRLEEIEGLALLLASEAGSYITGAVIPIDGGVIL
ncbi:SDR family NAD(P)-dependent oxidoreductase [Terrarubrum flagellatum]|uniref:SDR family NAD(P)-dependent oxidoreductase n=1 Tax=Terrirubrum flagellatum TaxID=2895980 RepID=UPI0031450363